VWIERHPKHIAGQAIDVTIVSARGKAVGTAAALAERGKRRKYGDEVARHFGMGFAPFAVDLDGALGPSAWGEMQAWARAISTKTDSPFGYSEAVDFVAARIANAFVIGCVRQIRAFELAQGGSWVGRGARSARCEGSL
jgi:hypothetical protein